jgi:O-antigen/teichoic acid export membrane protein
LPRIILEEAECRSRIRVGIPDGPAIESERCGLSNDVIPTEIKPTVHVDIGGRTLARNTMLNLAGQVAPALVAIFSIPYVIHHLGPDRFGLYSLAIIVVGYFALFDLGIGPATTKYVAELLGAGEIDKLPQLVWTAVASQTCMGLVGGIFLAALSPFLVEHVLKIPAGLHPEARMIFLIMAVALPVTFANGSLQGVLGASQRFDLLNAISIPTGVLTYLVPVAALALGFDLPVIVLSLVLVRVASSAIVLVVAIRLYPTLRRIRFDFGLVRSLLGFGGWVALSGAVGPILIYVDQFLIGAVLSIAAVGFYTPPFTIANKLGILPSCLVSTLFPAFSTSAGRGDSEWIRKTLIRALKFLILTVGPAALLLVFLARPLLTFWLGAKFANEGALALQILACGVLVNSLAYIPYSLLQGVNRPDLTAKFHLAELPIHIALVWFLVIHYGLPGAALAWTLRVTLDFVMLIVAACWITRTSPRLLAGRDIGRSLGALAVLGAGLLLLWSSTHVFIADAAFTLLLSGGFLIAAWHYVLNMEEKWQIRLLLRLAR